MRPLSAADSVSPAWQHTYRLLLARRDWRILLKIGAVAFFAEVGGFNSVGNGGNFPAGKAPAVMAALLAFIVLISIVALLIGLALFYLSSRLQFVLFDVVLRSDTTVAPIWRRYGTVTWRWMLVKFLFFVGALLCLAPVFVPMVIHIIRASANGASGQMANPASFVVSIIGSILLILLFVFIIAICYVLLRDFGLPSMALENAPMSVTIQRVLRLIQAEPGQITLYLVILLALRIACGIICYVILFFAALVAAIPFGWSRSCTLALFAPLRHRRPHRDDRRLHPPRRRLRHHCYPRRHHRLRLHVHLLPGVHALLPRWTLPHTRRFTRPLHTSTRAAPAAARLCLCRAAGLRASRLRYSGAGRPSTPGALRS